MVNGLPAFFGRKTPTIVPPGLDVTTITDVSGSMEDYARFITSAGLYEELETALQAELIGTEPATPNKYSFCLGADLRRGESSDLNDIEVEIEVNGIEQLWALGSDVLAQTVDYPVYSTGGAGRENMSRSTNLVSNNDREYNPLNELVIISGSDEQIGRAFDAFDQFPLYPQRYVGIHSAALTVDEQGLPPAPAGTLVGFIYTTAAEGVAVYIDGSTINYSTQLPTSAFEAEAVDGTQQDCINQAISTNGAIYDIRFFIDAARYALLGESLGKVLGKYLYSVS